jgi:hypothetical protein
MPCQCGPAACVLPPGVIASEVATCPNDGPGAETVPFSAPIGWQGACVEPPVIWDAAAESLIILPPELYACEPTTGSVPTAGSVFWSMEARACRRVDPLERCNHPALACAPASGGVEGGFRHCVFQDGEHDECPSGYPDRMIFYRNIHNDLTCTPCTCGPPQGAGCEVSISVYSDTACTALLATNNNPGVTPLCRDNLQPGDLRSMSATWLTNDPGTCEPAGGDSIGTATPTDPSTFCCMSQGAIP